MRGAWILVIVGALAGRSSAGVSAFGWSSDTEMLKVDKSELQTWISDEANAGDAHESTTSLWWIPVIGATSQLELAFPLVFEWTRSDGVTDRFDLDRYGIQARYRFARIKDPPAFVPVARVGVARKVTERATIRVEGEATVSYTKRWVHAVANLAYAGTLGGGEDEHEIYPSLGLSLRVSRELRVGGELVAELTSDHGARELEWVIAGPNLAWTHGRFWMTATAAIGLRGIRAAPRVLWGVQF